MTTCLLSTIMMLRCLLSLAAVTCLVSALFAAAGDQVRTQAGVVKAGSNGVAGVRAFLGIPFAAAPVGPWRWRAPQPPPSWSGVRKADHFGPRCMQAHPFEDMVFRDDGPSEDCLSLNVWTPASSASDRLPVMVWIYGGGFQAGGTSEPRQDGARLAAKRVVVVSMNYRLGVFGFFSHPDLTKESGVNASGNYGLMDQLAALEWVRKNIAEFGGDPGNVTIFGESAGSFSVSELMASPLGKGLFHRAIGESGGALDLDGTLDLLSLHESEQRGLHLAQTLNAASLADLRNLSAPQLLTASLKLGQFAFSPTIDGHVLLEPPQDIYARGAQSHIALLAGWNAAEGGTAALADDERATPAGLACYAREHFGPAAAQFLRLYPATTPEQARRSSAELAGDLFIAFGTWNWLNMHRDTARVPVYRYLFEQVRPDAPSDVRLYGHRSSELGARHASDIEYVFGTLDFENDVPWRAEDRAVSDAMMTYWANFARSGKPTGTGLPDWPEYAAGNGYQVMHLGPELRPEPEDHRARYQFLKRHHPRAAKGTT